jgi:GMP synthase (glutamine-hydrolysing)
MRICILRCGDVVPELARRRGEFGEWIRAGVGDAWRGEWFEHDLRTDAPLPDAAGPGAARAFIITGSSSYVTERAPWMLRAEAYLRELVARGAPVLGLCFGHQLLAKALGGDVCRNRRGREIGTVTVTKTGHDPLFAGVPDPFAANATHLESVERLPPGARVLASTALDPIAAYGIGDHVRCVQFHPEMDAEAVRGYIAACAPAMRAEGLDPDAVSEQAHDAYGPIILRAFVTAFVR